MTRRTATLTALVVGIVLCVAAAAWSGGAVAAAAVCLAVAFGAVYATT